MERQARNEFGAEGHGKLVILRAVGIRKSDAWRAAGCDPDPALRLRAGAEQALTLRPNCAAGTQMPR